MGPHAVPGVEAAATVGRRAEALVGLAEQFEGLAGGLADELLRGDLDLVVAIPRLTEGGAGAETEDEQGETEGLDEGMAFTPLKCRRMLEVQPARGY